MPTEEKNRVHVAFFIRRCGCVKFGRFFLRWVLGGAVFFGRFFVFLRSVGQVKTEKDAGVFQPLGARE
jgi:hypothetical protein